LHDVTSELAAVRARIAGAERKCNRELGSVQLVAVSKNFDAEHIRPALDAGQRIFGENRVQEAAAKWPELRSQFPDVELHLIGPLQSNKAALAVSLFDVIETVDREKIATAIAAEMHRQGRSPRLFVQVNTGREAQKAGILPENAVAFVDRLRENSGLSIDGLMCIPPAEEDPSIHFRMLAALAEKSGVNNLSMGMSGDFETAIVEGATHIRIGSAIFGAR
jgi:pyridoxal phosphate enzyme (YggS family)